MQRRVEQADGHRPPVHHRERRLDVALDEGEELVERGAEIDWRIDLVAVELDAKGKFLRCDHIPHIPQ
ncbi:MAG: hypothetical protein R6X32_02365 [Chloroflexota bacterium]